MEDSMDIDIDIGLDNDYVHPTENEALQPEAIIQAPAQVDDEIPAAYRDDFDADLPARDKVYILGLDGVAQPLIEQFIQEHATELKFKRLEWIDDSSANIIYYRPEDAKEALQKLSVAQDTLPASTELRPAKAFAARPDLQFSIRQALVSDKKKPGAKDRSAFYLFNPEWDPENRKYDRRFDRRGRGGRNGQRNGDDKGRERLAGTFTADMYDDAPEEKPASERRRNDADLFSGADRRDNGRLRDRSRSPDRGEDGRYGFSDAQPQRRTARRRSRTPPGRREARSANASKDLADRVAPAAIGNTGVELFPNHKRNRELFPHRTAHSNHRRSDALDKDETAEILRPAGASSLADRITGGPASSAAAVKGRSGGGLSIKGAGDAQSGFSIRGASKEVNPKVRELFPDRVPTPSNAGKELFPQRRRRAEDMLD